VTSDSESSNVVLSPPDRLRCDVVVVGSGPGGATTASKLADAGLEVLLLEEGPFLPLSSCRPFSRDEMVQKYRSGGLTFAAGRPKVVYAEGRCVGGGSEINSSLFHRTPPEILDQWSREFRVERLQADDLAGYFTACEEALHVGPVRGTPSPASLKLKEGAEHLGWKCLEARRAFQYDTSDAGQDQPRGTRQSMSTTFIPRALSAGCRLLPDTRVRSLAQREGRWRLVCEHSPLDKPRRKLEIKADNLFLSCGAVQTPALLRRSGIKKNVGNSLKLHPFIKLVARFAETVNLAGMGVPTHQVREFAPRFSLGCSISSQPHLALGLSEYPDDLPSLAANWPQMAAYYAMTSAGNGTVRVLPGFRDPLVRYRLLPDELADLAEGLRELCRLLFAAGAVELFPGIGATAPLHNLEDLSRLPARLSRSATFLTTVHLFSTCPMGEDKHRCATDSFGRVHGFKNLYVADASLLCGPPGINPQGSIMAIAMRNADHFLSNR
jgi:choline dehydrogenase-like flavoprotein